MFVIHLFPSLQNQRKNMLMLKGLAWTITYLKAAKMMGLDSWNFGLGNSEVLERGRKQDLLRFWFCLLNSCSQNA